MGPFASDDLYLNGCTGNGTLDYEMGKSECVSIDQVKYLLNFLTPFFSLPFCETIIFSHREDSSISTRKMYKMLFTQSLLVG